LDLGLTEDQGVQSPGYAVEVADRCLAIVAVEILSRSANHFACFLRENSLRRLLYALTSPWTHVDLCTVAGREEYGLLNFGSSTESAECRLGLRRGERETLTDFDRRREVAHANDGDRAQRKNPP
jgi:hypothetical protein